MEEAGDVINQRQAILSPRFYTAVKKKKKKKWRDKIFVVSPTIPAAHYHPST